MNEPQIRYPDLTLKILFCFLFFPVLSPGFVIKKAPFAPSKIYNGLIIKKNLNTYYLQPTNSNEKYELTFKDLITQKVTQRLVTGDYVSIEVRNTEPKKLDVLGINFVGLKSLLGLWRGDDNVCYYFKDFTNFIIFNTNSKGVCTEPSEPLNPKQARKMSYFVNPDDKDWFLLISDKSTQYAAELLLKNSKTIQFNLFDEQTGDIVSKVIIRR